MADDRNNTPAYVSYTTFKNAVRALAPDGEPPERIDKSLLKGMAGSTGAQFLGALRFLDLMDAQGKPTPRLVQLCQATSDIDWKPVMASVLTAKYEKQLAALKTGTPATFRESFGSDMGASIVIPASRFLFSAAKDVTFPISKHITEISGPRPAKKNNEKKPGAEAESKGGTTSIHPPAAPVAESFKDRLLAKFPEFNPEWDDAKQTAWFSAFEKFMAMTGEGGG